MANVAAWKAFIKRMGYSQAGADHLTQNEKVKTVSALRRLDAHKLSLTGKRMVSWRDHIQNESPSISWAQPVNLLKQTRRRFEGGRTP